MGGTMGGVLQIFFSAGEASLASQEPPGSAADSKKGGGGEGRDSVGAAWCRAFVAGVEGVEFYGGAKAGMRTVLDAIVPAAKVLQNRGPSGEYFSGGVFRGREGVLMIMDGRSRVRGRVGEGGKENNRGGGKRRYRTWNRHGTMQVH